MNPQNKASLPGRDAVDGHVFSCPMHEEPLRLIPADWRGKAVEELGLSNDHFKVKVDGDLDPACRFIFQKLMQRYCEYTMRFAHQTAACNSLHTIKQRACRWLLLVQDRAGTEQFALPQAILAEMLGGRRQSVSEVATFLRKKGLIEYRRGHITIVNRKKLEAAAKIVFSYGYQAVILEPEALRALVQERARAIAERNSSPAQISEQ